MKFACCLSDKPDVLIEIICDRFANQEEDDYVFFHKDYEFLRELTAELSTTIFTVHPLHNQFVNYFDSGNENRKEEMPVFVPSKMFKGMGSTGVSQVVLFSDNYTRSPAKGETTKTRRESSSQISLLDVTDDKNRTWNPSDENLLGRMFQYNEGKGEQVDGCLRHYHHSVFPLMNRDEEMEIVLKLLSKIKERASLFVREIDLCCLQSVCKGDKYFTLKINVFDADELLYATELIKEIGPYQKLGGNKLLLKDMNLSQESEMEKISSFKHVRSVKIIKHLIPLKWKELCEALLHPSQIEKIGEDASKKDVIQNLCHCRKITTLNLSNINLSDCHQKFLSFEMDNLKRLILKRTQLNTNDLVNLFQAISNNKFPDLIELNVSENTLDGCIHHLVEGPGLGLQSLEVLNLKDTHMANSDISALGTLCKQGRFPKLTTFILTGNELTGAINDILSDSNHTGFTNLETLKIKESQLNGSDVKSLSNAVKEGRLPKLKSLCLGLHSDEIYDMDVEEFIKTCVQHAQHEMYIRIEGQLSDNSCELMASVCAESYVDLKVKMRKDGKMDDDNDNDGNNVDSSEDDHSDNVDNSKDVADNFDISDYSGYGVDSSEDDHSDNVDNSEDIADNFDSNDYSGYNVDSSEDDNDYFSDD